MFNTHFIPITKKKYIVVLVTEWVCLHSENSTVCMQCPWAPVFTCKTRAYSICSALPVSIGGGPGVVVRPLLCTYRLNWARRTSWGWWDDWDDTVLQTQDSKFEPWRSEAEHATSRSRRLPTILTFTRGWGRNIFVFLKPPRPGTEPRTLAWKAAVLTTTLGPPPSY